jgi:hypothetical protein
VTDHVLRPGEPGYLPPKPAATATMELITPDLAEDLLTRMHANRTVSKIEKGVMAQLLKDGQFYGEISPVYFDDNGDWVLDPDAQDPYDGQHRLQAIVETRIPAWMWIIRGIRPHVAEFIDTGRRRMYADTLKIQGVTDYARQSAVARLLALYSNFGIESVRSPNAFPITRPQMDEWVDSPGLLDAVHFGVKLYKYAGLNENHSAYALMRTARVDARDAQGRATAVTLDPTGFWSAVRDGEGLERGDPAKALREWGMRKRTGQVPADKRLMMHYALATAWNKHVLGQGYAKVQPKYEYRSNGTPYFPAKSVPDYLPLGGGKQLLDEALHAYAAVRNTRSGS